jgi:hypothetical protein
MLLNKEGPLVKTKPTLNNFVKTPVFGTCQIYYHDHVVVVTHYGITANFNGEYR